MELFVELCVLCYDKHGGIAPDCARCPLLNCCLQTRFIDSLYNNPLPQTAVQPFLRHNPPQT